MPEFRQPILSLLGHVDHGKTTLLDRIAGSVRAEREAGGITQHIGAIEVPRTTILRLTAGILRGDQFQVPGLLIIDTPGHRSFETMRRRGGALADLAILVIDAREGVMPQTRESIQILKHERTPFAVAMTKIDLIPGWRRPTQQVSLAEHIARLGDEYSRALDARLYAVAEELLGQGFSAERYDRVSDFTRNVGITPVSAKHGVGIAELLALLVGLSQRFLKTELAVDDASSEATILERSDQRGIGPVAAVILYRGHIAEGDEIVVTGHSQPFTSRVRGLYRPAQGRGGKASKAMHLEGVRSVNAAAGLYLAAPGIEGAMPGGLLKVVRTPAELEEAQASLAQESHPVADLAESGVALAADTLGGLEALAFECREASIPIHEAQVGPVNGALVLKMSTVKDPTHRAVLAFNVAVLPDALPEGERGPVRVFRGEVMYRILEDYGKWRTERLTSLDQQRRVDTVHPAKLQVLPGFVFRSSKPAIVGVKVLAGTVRPGVRLMKPDGAEVGVLRGLQAEGKSVSHGEEGAELAAAIEGAVVGRSLFEGDLLYVALPESAARALKNAELSAGERNALDEVVKIRRLQSPFWGQ